jgi:ATP-dependent Lon protease
LVGVVTQRSPDAVEPTFEDLHQVGTLARVVKVIRLGQSNYSVVLNGLGRFQISEPLGLEPYMQANIERLRSTKVVDPALEMLARKLRDRTRAVLALLPDMPRETAGILDNVHEPGALADLIAANLPEEIAKLRSGSRSWNAVWTWCWASSSVS